MLAADGRAIEFTLWSRSREKWIRQRSRKLHEERSPTCSRFLTNEYDAASRVIRQTQAGSTTWQSAYTLDAGGKITQTDLTNPRGYVQRVTFSTAGYPLTDTQAQGNALAQTMTYTRQSGTNFILTATDPLSRQTAFTYDTRGSVATATRLNG